MQNKITTIHAFIAEEEDGSEGLCAFQSPGYGWIPMVAADPDRVQSLREYAEGIARSTGRPVKLIRFSVRSDLEVIHG